MTLRDASDRVVKHLLAQRQRDPRDSVLVDTWNEIANSNDLDRDYESLGWPEDVKRLWYSLLDMMTQSIHQLMASNPDQMLQYGRPEKVMKSVIAVISEINKEMIPPEFQPKPSP